MPYGAILASPTANDALRIDQLLLHRILECCIDERTNAQETVPAAILLSLAALWLAGAVQVYADYQVRTALALESTRIVTSAEPDEIEISDIETEVLAPTTTPAPTLPPGALYADLRSSFDPEIFHPTVREPGPGEHYGGPFMAQNLVQGANNLALMIRARTRPLSPTMAGLKSRARFGYGRYETIMRPSGEDGIVSSFFTYTGPWSGDPHDEIDIEFVGSRPTHIEFNYFKNGVRGQYARLPLGFDASDSLNLYGYDWLPDQIIWYVNGEEIYRTQTDGSDIPTHAGTLIINAWAGTERMRVWTGPLRFGAEAQADYACLSFTPIGETARSCADQWAESRG